VNTATTAEKLAEKVWGLRILAEEESASDLNAPLLVVSQFTLYASTRKGRRPSWSAAAPGPVSEPLVDHFVTPAQLGSPILSCTDCSVPIIGVDENRHRAVVD
jgi:D-Tyr-tRNAtyr deacylase